LLKIVGLVKKNRDFDSDSILQKNRDLYLRNRYRTNCVFKLQFLIFIFAVLLPDLSTFVILQGVWKKIETVLICQHCR